MDPDSDRRAYEDALRDPYIGTRFAEFLTGLLEGWNEEDEARARALAAAADAPSREDDGGGDRPWVDWDDLAASQAESDELARDPWAQHDDPDAWDALVAELESDPNAAADEILEEA